MLGVTTRTKSENATHIRVIGEWVTIEGGERLGVLDKLEQVAPRLGVRRPRLVQCVNPCSRRDVMEQEEDLLHAIRDDNPSVSPSALVGFTLPVQARLGFI